MSTIKVRLSKGRTFRLQRKLVILDIRSSETSSRAPSTDSQQRSAESVSILPTRMRQSKNTLIQESLDSVVIPTNGLRLSV